MAHGIGVSSAHRALTDCQLLSALFDRMEDLPGLIAAAASPKRLVRGDVSYGDRQLAKDAGFRWDGDSKQWLCKLSENELAKLPFRYTVLESAVPEGAALPGTALPGTAPEQADSRSTEPKTSEKVSGKTVAPIQSPLEHPVVKFSKVADDTIPFQVKSP
ncbi:MAG: hypothetical protein HC857_07775 [Synechococcales cyanobacterium RU_4_20]|nr:hypothetical protein [Synechococcales cyanobacterium RU_4_20]